MYRVIVMSTHLYKDDEKTQKKGHVSGGTTFESAGWGKDNDGNPMVKTNLIQYIPNDSTVITNGDGWLIGSEVEKVVTDVDPGPQPGEDPAPISTISDAELGYAVRIVLEAAAEAFRGM